MLAGPGAAGEQFGLLLFRSLDDYEASARLAEGTSLRPEGRRAGRMPTITTDDYQLAMACREGVRAFLEENRRIFREPTKGSGKRYRKCCMPR